MDNVTFEIQNKAQIDRMWKELPLIYRRRALVSAFRKSARPLVKSIRRGVPGNSADIKKAVKVKAIKKQPAVSVGIQSGSFINRYGKKVLTWFAAYWSAYGTNARRDPSHTFKRQRRKPGESYRGGISPTNFVEKAWDQTKTQVENDYAKNMADYTDKQFKKYKSR